STQGKTRRGFCARCGSTLTCESVRQPGETHFHIGAFDEPARLAPTRHIFPEEQLPWLHLGDD
ncbi:MAG TPA: GFA family protein, partial [Stellaceae bacterium]|nr:GFA family protein [Stellaceae bacterium]